MKKIVELFPFHDLEEAYEYCQNGGKEFPAHHFWGFDKIKEGGFEPVWIDFNENSLINRLGRKIRIWNLQQQINCLKRSKNYDLIYDPFMQFSSFLVLLRLVGLFRKPLVAIAPHPFVEEDRHWLIKFKQWLINQLYYRGVDHLLFLNESIYKKAVALGKSRAKYPLKGWGADLAFFESFSKNQKERPREDYIFSTGGSHRDYPTLLTAFHEIDFSLKVTTTGGLQSELEPLIKPNIHLNDSIKPGLTSTGRLRKDYYDALAVAIPLKKMDSFMPVGSTVVMEAFAMAKPVITTQNDAYPLDVEKEKVGFNIAPGDVEGWRQAINYAITHPDEMREMGQRAFHICRKRFNYKIFSKELVDYLSEFVEPGSAKQNLNANDQSVNERMKHEFIQNEL